MCFFFKYFYHMLTLCLLLFKITEMKTLVHFFQERKKSAELFRECEMSADFFFVSAGESAAHVSKMSALKL